MKEIHGRFWSPHLEIPSGQGVPACHPQSKLVQEPATLPGITFENQPNSQKATFSLANTVKISRDGVAETVCPEP